MELWETEVVRNATTKTEVGWQMISWGDVTHLQGLKTLDDA